MIAVRAIQNTRRKRADRNHTPRPNNKLERRGDPLAGSPLP